MSEAADILREARALIKTKGWAQGEYARDAEGFGCNPLDDGAVAFCLEGALHAASHTPWNLSTRTIPGHVLLESLAGDNLARWNDDVAGTKDDAIALIDRALALAEARP